MSEDRPSRRRALFEAVADLAPSERDAFLHQACDGDAALRAEVEALLDHDEASNTAFLRSPVQRATPASGIPETIGRYRVTGRIGTGGMGVVYEGAQESPNRPVAIKLIRPEMISERMLSRFRNEAEILGRLEHPGIARIYEAGTAPADASGGPDRPFFAMELVRGTPLLDHARGLTTRDRLRLFADICDAVHHAHQKGVIHRDLKPANILVDEEGQVKILDFGVARATDGDIQCVTVHTDVGQLLGTVPYMSPEQVLGDVSRLDTRSDVYSLGVVLFELLTGALPYDVRERSVPEAARIIRDEESTRLSTIMPHLRGDLEWIVAKAIEKDVDRRYDSASALAADVRRHLADEPVLAGPPSAAYRLRKLVRRNKVGAAWAAVATLLLAVGLPATITLTIRSLRAEQAASSASESWRRESDRSRLSADFLVSVLSNAVPGDAAIIRQTLLDDASERIEGLFGDDPSDEADVRRMLGDIYSQTGDYVSAYEQLLLAYELIKANAAQDAFGGAAHAEVLAELQICALALYGEGPVAQAWRNKALTALEFGPDHHDPQLAQALRDMRRDLIVLDVAKPDRATQDQHLERVMAAYWRTPSPDAVGLSVAGYLLFMITHVGNVFQDVNIKYAQAASDILNVIGGPRAARQLGMAFWLEARQPAPDGDEERRVKIAERLVTEWFGYADWWLYDFESILGAALVQRGQQADQAEIMRLLTNGTRHLRELASAGAPAMVEMNLGASLFRLSGFGLKGDVLHLVDHPELLDELAAGAEVMLRSSDERTAGRATSLLALAGAMSARKGRSARWYEVAEGIAERARPLLPADATRIRE